MDMEKITRLINEFVEANLTSFKYDEGNLHIELTRDTDNNVRVMQQEGDINDTFVYETHENFTNKEASYKDEYSISKDNYNGYDDSYDDYDDYDEGFEEGDDLGDGYEGDDDFVYLDELL